MATSRLSKSTVVFELDVGTNEVVDSPLGVPAYLVTRMIKELLDDIAWT